MTNLLNLRSTSYAQNELQGTTRSMATALFDRANTENLLRDLRRANSEQAKKERFLQYLTVMFAGDDASQILISDLSLGAERTISNIPRGPFIGRGRADTQTETVIIEWEKDLSKTGAHAKEQLEEYTSSATDASAVLIDRLTFDLPFIVEHKTYWCEVRSPAEGNYVAAFLNSGYANEAIKDFQSQGLFGERDIHKTIVKLPLAAFDRRNEAHMRISRLAERCAERSAEFASAARLAELDPRSLGRARTQLRRHLQREMLEIDVHFYAMSSREGAVEMARTRRLQRGAAGPLFTE